MERVILVSGGVDSYIMSQEFEGVNVYIDFGQPYAQQELQALKSLQVDVSIITLRGYKSNFNDVYIPDRNLFFACVAEMYYNADEIYMAGLRDDNCKDKTEEEFRIMSEILTRYANKEVRVISPYWHKSKGELIRDYQGDKSKLAYTFSCYAPRGNEPCGNCPACLRRVIALETNHIDSRLTLSDEIVSEYQTKITEYDADRQSRFVAYKNSR